MKISLQALFAQLSYINYSKATLDCCKLLAAILCFVLVAPADAQGVPPDTNTMIINRLGTPTAMQDFDSYGNQRYNPLFGRGSWHGFLLPDQVEHRAGFTGPLIVAEEYAIFLASALDTLDIIDVHTKQSFDKSRAKWSYRESWDGLHQSLIWPDLELQLSLRFVSANTAMVQTRIINTRHHSHSLELRWHGKLLSQWQTTTSAQAQRSSLIADVSTKFPHWQRTLSETDDTLIVNLGRLRSTTDVMVSGSGQYWIHRSLKTHTTISDLAYESRTDLIRLAPNSHLTVYTTHHYALDAADLIAAQASAKLSMSKPAQMWQKTAQQGLKSSSNPRTHLQAKAKATLIDNWRHPAGAIAYEGVVPSTTSRWFNCMWGWDSYKHAYALSEMNSSLAKNQIRAMFASQIQEDDMLRPFDAGMIIDNVCYNRDALRGGDGYNWNERNTKPPLAAWASWKIYTEDHDRAWLAEIYPKLKAFHAWWYRRRDINHNGLVEFGATSHPEHHNPQGDLKFSVNTTNPHWQQQCTAAGTQQLVCYGMALYKQAQQEGLEVFAPAQEGTGYESGMDNAARFGFIEPEQLEQNAKQYHQGDLTRARAAWQVGFFENRNAEGKLLAYSMNQESVDLNAFMYADKLYLAQIAQALALKEDAAEWRRQAKQLKEKINRCMYDPASAYFYDRQLRTIEAQANSCADGELLTQRGMGSEAFAVLWAGAADAKKAKSVIARWQDPSKFASFLPFPTAAIDNPAFHPTSYWRGRVWIDQAYFALKGLQQYGESRLARKMARQLISNAEGIKSDAPFRENYHPFNGKGQGPANFSWSAAHFWMIEREILTSSAKTKH